MNKQREEHRPNISFFLFFQMAAGSIENEGPDSGVGDFVLLSEINMNAFVKNLKLRSHFPCPSFFSVCDLRS